MAGHSKWANIQHRKGRQDAVRSKLFSKLSKEITVAAKMGDPDPEKNPRLRMAVKEAKSVSVPKDVIDRAIKKSTAGEGDDYEEIRYEGYGPNGVAVIVETMTDNRNRTASTVRSTFTKNCADSDLNMVATALESELGESVSTKLIWKPTMTTELDLEGMQKLMKLVDALEDDDDVQRVTSNFEASDEVMDQL